MRRLQSSINLPELLTTGYTVYEVIREIWRNRYKIFEIITKIANSREGLQSFYSFILVLGAKAAKRESELLSFELSPMRKTRMKDWAVLLFCPCTMEPRRRNLRVKMERILADYTRLAKGKTLGYLG